jgi:thiol:disulfide interchange protein DsbA
MDKFHKPFFSAMHVDKKRLGSKEEVRDFFAGIGVGNEDFDGAFDSFAVQAKVRRAADLTKKYGISGVPSIAVEGKYLVDGPMAKSYENMLRIVNALVEKEAAGKKN